jgi:hypothetical protein
LSVRDHPKAATRSWQLTRRDGFELDTLIIPSASSQFV